jgi:hypothetical protein
MAFQFPGKSAPGKPFATAPLSASNRHSGVDVNESAWVDFFALT